MERAIESLYREQPRWRLWLLAVRPKTFTAILLPVLLGELLAYRAVALFDWWIAFLCLAASVLIHAAANLLNDAFDFQRGADDKDRVGFPRVTQMGIFSFSQIIAAAFLCLFGSLLLSIPLIYQGGILTALLFFLSVCGAYFYTGGPFPLAYNRLGECAVFLFYGFVNIFVSYYVLAHRFHIIPFLAGCQMGLLATALVSVNNLRDIYSDAKAHKRTLAVYFGVAKTRLILICLLLSPFILNAYWIYFGYFRVAVLTSTCFPLACMICLSIRRTEPSPLFNRFFSQTALLHFLFGLLLAIGLIIS